MFTGIFLKEEVRVGDILTLHRDENDFTEMVGLILKKEGVEVGKLSSTSTLLEDGSRICGELLNEKRLPSLRVVRIGRLKSSTIDTRSCLLEIVEAVSKKIISFEVTGSIIKYKARTALLDDLKKGQQPVIQIEDGVAYRDGQPVGEVVDKKYKGNAICKSANGIAVVAEIEISTKDVFTDDKMTALKKDFSQKLLEISTEIEHYLNANDIPNETIFKVFTYLKENFDGNVVDKPNHVYVGQATLKKTLVYTFLGKNVLLEGERGAGKNVLTETLSWIFQRPLYEFSMNSQHDNVAIFGGKEISPDEEGKLKTVFMPDTILQAVQNGGLLVIDEINAGLPHVWTLLHSLLDSRRRVTVPGYGTVEAHKAFRCVGTQNLAYTGTFGKNEASNDRFITVTVPSPSRKDLEKIIKSRFAVANEDLQIALNMYAAMQDAVNKSDGILRPETLTVRGIIDACEVSMHGIDIYEALTDCVINRTEDIVSRKELGEILANI